MKDYPEFNIQFVHLIKENPCLYDHNNCNYSNRDVQDLAWERIANELRESVHDCKERWKNLRACYTRYLKSLNDASGLQGTSKNRRPYYLTEYLSFLKPFTKTRPPRGTAEYAEIYQISSESKNMQLFPEVAHCGRNSEDESGGIVKAEFEFEDLSQENETKCSEDLSFTCSPYPKKFKREQEGTILDEGSKTNYDSCQGQNCNEKINSEDPDFMFLQSILPDMKEMNNAQKREFKIGVLHLASKILMECGRTTVQSTLPSSSTLLTEISTVQQTEDNLATI